MIYRTTLDGSLFKIVTLDPLAGSKASDKPELLVDGNRLASNMMRRISQMILDNSPTCLVKLPQAAKLPRHA
jgi:hypothetical protein